jgi:hypothetical protein
MNRIVGLLLGLVYATVVSTHAFASDDHSQSFLLRDLAIMTAPIKSQSDLQQYMQASEKQSPFKALSPGAQERLIASMTFNDEGLTGLRYDDLEAELSPTQIYRILALFGKQHLTGILDKAKIDTKLDDEIMNVFSPPSTTFCHNEPLGVGRDSEMPSCWGADHKGYECERRATCRAAMSRICMSNC